MKAAAPAPARDYAKLYAAAEAASATVMESMPSVLAIGTHLADAGHAYSAWDEVALVEPDEPQRRLGAVATYARDTAGLRKQALRELLATMPAASIEDAAVLVAEAAEIAGFLSGANSTPVATVEAADAIERMLLSALPFIARAAGLDMERMNWSAGESLRQHRFAGVGVQS